MAGKSRSRKTEAGPGQAPGPSDGRAFDAESLNRAVLGTVEALVIALDPDGRIVLFNRACEALTGYAGEEVAGRRFWDFLLTPEESERAKRVFAELKASQFPNRHVNHWVAKDGTRRLIEWSNTCLLDQAGAVTLVVGTGIDMTDRVAQEAALRESERRLAVAQEQAKIGYWSWSLDERGMEYVSDLYTEILGLARHEVPRRQAEFNRFIHPEDRERTAALFDAVCREPRDYQTDYRIVRPDGEVRHVVEIGELARDGAGRPTGHTGFIQDVTPIKQAEQAARASEARLAGILDIAPEAIISTDESGRIQLFNQGAEEIFGYETEEVLGEPIDTLIPERFRAGHVKHMKDFAGGQEVRRYMNRPGQIFGRRKDGSEFPAEASISRLALGGETVFTVLLHDITERKLAEQALIAAKQDADLANRAKSEFLANMSHELRTPLNAIIGFAELIEQQMIGPVGNEAYVEHAHEIREAGQHLLRLISDILDLSRIEAGKLELREDNVDLREAIRGALFLTGGLVRHGEVAVEQAIAEELPRLRVDERKLKQMLVNLLSNAFKFTPDGGTVTIAASYDEERGFEIRVDDTGIGMSVEDIPKAMVRFGQVDSSMTRRFGGTGLGLPLTKALVELHGGSLAVESTLGQGTTVTLTFPAARAVTARGTAGLLGTWRRRRAGAGS